MTRQILISMVAVAIFFVGGGCQLHPRPTDVAGELLPPAPSAAEPFHVSGMRVQMLGPATYLYSSINTSFENMPGPVSQAMAALQQLPDTGKIRQPVLLVYHDPTENPAEPFDLDIGLPVPDGIVSAPGYSIRSLPKFHCATAIYRGPMKLLPKAYEALIPEMIAARLVPSAETRESYLIWESPESPNNVVQIEVGIQ